MGTCLTFALLVMANQALSQTLYFPVIISGATWESEICVVNTSDESLTGTFHFFDGSQTASSPTHNFTLQPFGRIQQKVVTLFPSGTTGYITLETTTPAASGYLKLTIDGYGRVAVPAVSGLNANGILLPHISSDDYWWTGICLSNTTDTTKQVQFEFNNGTSIERAIAGNSLDSFALWELFGGKAPLDIQSAVIKNTDGIVGMELFGTHPESGATYLGGIGLTDETSTTLYYPHISADDTWVTGIVVFNPNSDSSELTITPYAMDGTALPAQSRTLGPLEKYVGTVESLGLSGQTQWIQVEATLPVTGLALVGTHDGRQLAGYTALTGASQSGIFPNNPTEGWTEIVMANIGNMPATVLLTAYNDEGSIIAAASTSLNSHEKSMDSTGGYFNDDIIGATHIRYDSDHPLIGCQLNGSIDGLLLDALPLKNTSASGPANRSYTIVDTGQNIFYNNSIAITEPAEGAAFYGQDAHFYGNQPSYTLSEDGLTVADTITGLTWIKSPDLDGNGHIDPNDKLSFSAAQSYPATLNAGNYGGYSDWRLPTMKELYSLMNFKGTDPMVMGTDTSGLTPFIDTGYFDFAYGDTAAGERIIDSQFWSANAYVGTVFGSQSAAFGLNIADGRIKGYPTSEFISKTNYVYYVRGNPDYGLNSFKDNGDGTVTDSATGLMWSKDDSDAGMNWEDALLWAQQKNGENHLGHSDWRLPNAKEMQSIMDYSRAPDTTGSGAIDPVFNITRIINENGEADYPWFWTGTTHARSDGTGRSGVYLCFGRAMGYIGGSWLDVHGAGAQRSDQKKDDFSNFTYAPDGYYFGQSPQGDATRIYNYVRLVRNDDTILEKSVSINVTAHPENTLMAIASVTTDSNASVSIEFTADTVQPHQTSATPSQRQHEVVVYGMRAETTYRLKAIANFADGSVAMSETVDFTTGILPVSAPETEISSSRAGTLGGITFFGISSDREQGSTNDPVYYGVDEQGEIVWYLHGGDSTPPTTSIRQIEPGVLMVFLSNSVKTVTPEGESIREYSLSSIGRYHHDAILLPSGNLMILGSENASYNGENLAGDIIYELDTNGNVVWEWSAFDHLDPTRFPGALSETQTMGGSALDWTHCNSLFHIEDGNTLLISSRSQSWVIKIDRSTGNIVWILGDDAGTAPGFNESFFSLDSGSWMTSQHAAMVTADGQILLYDNRNESDGVLLNSRAVKYSLDESTMTANQTWEAVAPIYTMSFGDVDELPNENILICAGGQSGKPMNSGASSAHIIEVSKDAPAETLWELTVNMAVYRAERISWDQFL